MRTNHRKTPARLLLPLLLGTACSDLSTSSATRLEDAPPLTLREELRIGSSTDPNLGFTLITGVDVDRAGNVYAFDSREVEFRVFDKAGNFVRKFGRRGEGPGEFTSSPSFGITGDTLWALVREGPATRKLTLFNLQGEVLRTSSASGVRVRLQGDRGTGVVFPYTMRDGHFFGRLTTYTSSRPDDPPAPAATDTLLVPIVRWSLTGEIVDTAGWYPMPPRTQRDAPFSIRPGGRFVIVPQPPSEEFILVTLDDQVLVVDNRSPSDAATASVRLTRLKGNGDTVFTRAYGFVPNPYDEATLAALAWRTARTGGAVPIIDGVPTPRPTPDDSMLAYTELRAVMDFPPFQLAFRSEMVGADGTVWLARYDSDNFGNWIVFDESGRLIGQLNVPSNTRLLYINGDEIWASVSDEMDVPWLVRFSLRKGG